MSDYCPHCDDFSIDASRARREPVKNDRASDINVSKKHRKIIINVDDSDENADWIKRVSDEEKDERKG